MCVRARARASLQWDLFVAGSTLTEWDDYCSWGSFGICGIALGRVLLHAMEDHLLALRICQATWMSFVLLLPITGLGWKPVLQEGEVWTIDEWVHDMDSWSAICVIGYLLMGGLHGSLGLPLPFLAAGSLSTIASSGGVSLIHDVIQGGEVRDAVGIVSWLCAYLFGVVVSAGVAVPAAHHFIVSEKRAENLRCSKERLEYDLAAATQKQNLSHLAQPAHGISAHPVHLSMLQDGRHHPGSRGLGAASVASSESFVTAVHTANEDTTADEEPPATALAATPQPWQPMAAEALAAGAGRAPSVAGSHCTASSMLTIEADAQLLEQRLIIGNSEYDSLETSDDV